MKLLFVLPEFAPQYGGGIVTFYRDLLPQMVRMGHKVDVIVGSPMTDYRLPYEFEGVRVSFLERARVAKLVNDFGDYAATPDLRRFLAAAWAIWEQVGRGASYDLVEVCDWGVLFVPWVTAETRPPAVVQFHGSNGQISFHDPLEGMEHEGLVTRLLECAVLRSADALQTHSRQSVEEWQQRLSRTVQYIPPSIGRNSASPISSRSGGIAVGRIQRWKGPHILCQAMRLASKSIELDWIGRDVPHGQRDGSTSQRLSADFPDVWGPRVRPTGQLSPPEVARRLASARFVVVPSTWDVFNYVAAEAMLVETPIICSSAAGAADLIEHGTNGFIFQSENVEELAALLDELHMMSEVKLRAVGREGRAIVERVMNPARVAEAKLATYVEIIAGSGPRPKADYWVTQACTPSGNPRHDLRFLDNQSLKSVSSYWARRMVGKVVKRLHAFP